MMRFEYVITHVPGKQLQIADALSRSPVSLATDADYELHRDVSAYVDLLVQTLSASNHQLQLVKKAKDSNDTCIQIKSYCLNGSVWWPAINKDIEEAINHCMVGCTARFQHAEPLLSSEFPDYLWQPVASDLFEWKKSKYLLVIDYHSRYIEIARLSTATSSNVITHMKSLFAYHGVP